MSLLGPINLTCILNQCIVARISLWTQILPVEPRRTACGMTVHGSQYSSSSKNQTDKDNTAAVALTYAPITLHWAPCTPHASVTGRTKPLHKLSCRSPVGPHPTSLNVATAVLWSSDQVLGSREHLRPVSEDLGLGIETQWQSLCFWVEAKQGLGNGKGLTKARSALAWDSEPPPHQLGGLEERYKLPRASVFLYFKCCRWLFLLPIFTKFCVRLINVVASTSIVWKTNRK